MTKKVREKKSISKCVESEEKIRLVLLNKNTALQINNDHATSYSDDECAIMIQSRMLSLQTT